MIIGIDATRANKAQKTGVEWYSYHLIRELAKLPTDHAIRLYFNASPEPGLANLGSNVEYRILRWPFRYLWTQIRLSWEMLMHPPDLLFIPAQIIPLIHPSRTVTTIHDVAFKPYPESYRPWSRWYLNLAAKLAAKLPLILTISEFSKKEITKYYDIAPERITVTYLGFLHETRVPTMDATIRLAIREPYLLYIGRLERKKNIIALIKSFELIKKESWGQRQHLVLVGTKGYGWDEINKLIGSSANKDDIIVAGWVTQAEKNRLLDHATALIMLSAYEGFGLPVLEAMDARTPVITSDQASLPEIGGTATVQVPRGDTRAVRDALRDIIFNDALRNKLLDVGSLQVKQFTWHTTAEKTLVAFEGLLKHP